jgi:hypothetical protein
MMNMSGNANKDNKEPPVSYRREYGIPVGNGSELLEVERKRKGEIAERRGESKQPSTAIIVVVQ